MKQIILTLVATLLAITTPQADDGVRLRYVDPAARLSMTIAHDIEVVREPPIHANRRFAVDLTLAAAPAGGAVTVTIDEAKGSTEAHAQRQRLGTRHLTGKSFALSFDEDGRKPVPGEAAEENTIGLGSIVPQGFPLPDALADALPILPDTPVAVGTRWTTERSIRSLEGWAWSTGKLTSRHEVTSIDERDAHAIVTVQTEAAADLGPIEGGEPCAAELTRTLNWTFDATDGRLLTLSVDQETEGRSTVPQGEITIRQHTLIELFPSS
jgi:hypothetical protein